MKQILSITAKISLSLVAVFLLANCTKKTPPLEYFNQMYDSPAREAQEEDYFAKNNSSSRIPPYGAIPVGYYPYPYIDVLNPDDLSGPSKGLANPLKNPNLDDYKVGEQKYQTYCTPCHGVQGAGNGKVVGPYPRFATAPPAVTSGKIKGWSDGQLYHIITMGRGVMGSYAYQIEPDDRWKLVAYIRKLQEYDSKKGK
ncbi:MAG: cytochrome c [Oceanicaulis sp.]|nr:cytochrome c [Leptospira sp.]MCH8491374.1 cytochrome c [Oceanicaulis sp.]